MPQLLRALPLPLSRFFYRFSPRLAACLRALRIALPALAFGLWLALPAPAAAQALDEAHFVSDGKDAILKVHFNVRVQYQRHAPLAASDLIEVYFLLVGNDESLTRPIEETLSVAAMDTAPAAGIVYPVQTGLPVKKLVIHLGRKADFRVRAGGDNQVIEIVFPGLGAKTQAPVAAPVNERDRFAIVLQSVPVGDREGVRAVPARLQDYAVFGSEVVRNGVRYYELVLGYFETRAQAEKVLASLQSDFPNAQVFDVLERKRANLEVAATLPPPPPEPPPPPAAAEAPGPAAAAAEAVAKAPETEIDKQGGALMAKAKAALVVGKNDDAIEILNQLLLLPPNKYSQDAQELVGLARERAGQLDLARKEYELYLRLFPSGPGATRVRQRLAVLAPPAESTTVAAKPVEKRGPQYSAGGSISQYYYGGDQHVQTIFNTPVTVSQATVTNNAQSSIVSTVDLNGRYRTDTNDTRIVFRDSDQYSLLNQPTAPSLNRMDAAYIDYRNSETSLTVKAGRQAGVTGGLVGRYDGAAVGVDVAPKIRITSVIGVPVAQDQFVSATQMFEGVSLEAQNFAEHWGGSAFIINQTADRIVDRRAVGGDVRYFDQTKTLYALVDYDVQFATLNAATLQATYQLPDQTSFALLADDRKAPTLETSNGLLQTGCLSYAQYFDPNNVCHAAGATGPYSVAALRQDALATTADSHQIGFDVSRPFGKQLQVSADVRVSSVGALPTVVLNGQTFQGTPATGNTLSASIQASATNLYSKRDIDVASLTYLHSETTRGEQISLNNLNGFMDNRLSVEPNAAYYRETDTTGQHLYRISPGVRGSFKILPRLSVDGTMAVEWTRNSGSTQNDSTLSIFWYVGYRYDLNF